MPRTLPPHVTVESLKKEAKAWLRLLRAGDFDARARLDAAVPGSPAEPGLRHVQLALARDYGQPGWGDLMVAAEEQMLARRDLADLATELLRSAWDGDVPAARRIAARRPEISKQDIHTAVICGDLPEVERRLSRNPDAAKVKGGPHDWEPLLYLAYGRIADAGGTALEIARLLLDHGGNPAAQFDDGWGNAFTLITGLIGHGETGRPEHPRAAELADLVIAAGADPFDTQTMYDTSLEEDDPRWLAFLFDRVAARGEETRWHEPANGLTGRNRLPALDYLLGNAVGFGHARRAEWLLDHGADANAIHAYSGRPLLLEALLAGHVTVAAVLERHGAGPVQMNESQRFVAACARGDIAGVRDLAADHPRLVRDPSGLILAAQRGDEQMTAALLALGTDTDGAPPDGKRALHWAAQNGHVGVARQLIEAGSDIDRRGSPYDATPLGFASYFGQATMIDLLAPLSRDLFGLTRAAKLDRLAELITAEPALITKRNKESETLLFALPDDEDTAADVAEFLLGHGIDPSIADARGETADKAAHRRGLEEAAALIEAAKK